MHPRPGRAALVPRLGHGQQELAPLLYEHGIRATASPLYFQAHNPELSLLPSRLRMASVLDPCTHIRQLARADRAAAFRALPFGDDPEPYVPDAATNATASSREPACTAIASTGDASALDERPGLLIAAGQHEIGGQRRPRPRRDLAERPLEGLDAERHAIEPL